MKYKAYLIRDKILREMGYSSYQDYLLMHEMHKEFKRLKGRLSKQRRHNAPR